MSDKYTREFFAKFKKLTVFQEGERPKGFLKNDPERIFEVYAYNPKDESWPIKVIYPQGTDGLHYLQNIQLIPPESEALKRIFYNPWAVKNTVLEFASQNFSTKEDAINYSKSIKGTSSYGYREFNPETGQYDKLIEATSLND